MKAGEIKVTFIYPTCKLEMIGTAEEVLELTKLKDTDQRFVQINQPNGKVIWVNLNTLIAIEIEEPR